MKDRPTGGASKINAPSKMPIAIGPRPDFQPGLVAGSSSFLIQYSKQSRKIVKKSRTNKL